MCLTPRPSSQIRARTTKLSASFLGSSPRPGWFRPPSTGPDSLPNRPSCEQPSLPKKWERQHERESRKAISFFGVALLSPSSFGAVLLCLMLGWCCFPHLGGAPFSSLLLFSKVIVKLSQVATVDHDGMPSPTSSQNTSNVMMMMMMMTLKEVRPTVVRGLALQA